MEPNPYESIGTTPSANVLKTLTSARAQYNKMLVELNTFDPVKFPHKTLASIPTPQLTSCMDTFSRFGSFMFTNDKFKCDTCLSYLSSIRNHILARNSDSDIGKGQFFHQYRTLVKNKFLTRAVAAEQALAETSDPFTEDHLVRISTFLFSKSPQRNSCQYACIVTLLWQLLARVSELKNLKTGSFKYYPNLAGILVKMFRGKTNKIHSILLFPHVTDMYSCPLHALGKERRFCVVCLLVLTLLCFILCIAATHLVLNPTDSRLFLDLHEVRQAQRVNHVLRAVQAQLAHNVEEPDGAVLPFVATLSSPSRSEPPSAASSSSSSAVVVSPGYTHHPEQSLQSEIREQMRQLSDSVKATMENMQLQLTRALGQNRKRKRTSTTSSSVAASESSGASSDSTNTSAPPLVLRIPSHAVHAMHAVPAHRLPPDLTESRKALFGRQLYTQWYEHEWDKCKTSSVEERRVLVRLGNTVRLLDRFLPDGEPVPPRPPVSPEDSDEFIAWRAELLRLATIVEDRAHQLIVEKKDDTQ